MVETQNTAQFEFSNTVTTSSSTRIYNYTATIGTPLNEEQTQKIQEIFKNLQVNRAQLEQFDRIHHQIDSTMKVTKANGEEVKTYAENPIESNTHFDKGSSTPQSIADVARSVWQAVYPTATPITSQAPAIAAPLTFTVSFNQHNPDNHENNKKLIAFILDDQNSRWIDFVEKFKPSENNATHIKYDPGNEAGLKLLRDRTVLAYNQYYKNHEIERPDNISQRAAKRLVALFEGLELSQRHEIITKLTQE